MWIDPMMKRTSSVLPSRRDLLSWTTGGLTGAAFLHLLARDGMVRAGTTPGEAGSSLPLASSSARQVAAAKRVIHVCLCGGLSQLDSFDYKPELARWHGKALPGTEKPETFFGQ